MTKKSIGLLLCMLLIASVTIPLVTSRTIETNEEDESRSVVDQQQIITTELHWLPPSVPNWQEFKNRGTMIEEVQLHFGNYASGSAPVYFSIRESLAGPPITDVTVPASAFPPNVQTWFTFNVPDVAVTPGMVYYMVVKFDPGSEYAWSGAHGDPYPNGGSSHTDPDWDYAFKTVVDKSTARTINSPLFN
jgi:hypothetical protein